MNRVSPERTLQVGLGYWQARTLQVAVKLGIFTLLGDGRQMTGYELCKELGLSHRANPDFFDALVALHFLEREGDWPDAAYSNGEEASIYLDRNSPSYIGGLFEMMHDRLYPFWGDLLEALKTGKPQNELKNGGSSLFVELYSDPEKLEHFLAAMSGISTANAIAFAEKFDFSPYRTLCDIGGAEGVLAIEVARAKPDIHCTTADLPPVEPIARRKIAAAGLEDRVDAISMDYLKGPLPRADVIVMGMILLNCDLPTKKMLVHKAYDALPRGGAFAVIEPLLDDGRRENVMAHMASLNMLIETGDAFGYTGADFWEWCREAGFSRYEVFPLSETASAAVAYK